MSTQPIIINSLPAANKVVEALQSCLSQEQIDLRDVTSIVKQDPVLLASFLIQVNALFSEKSRPVVNTLSSAINLVGLSQLKEYLLSVNNVASTDMSLEKANACELIRDRITTAANLTQFWADYMGEQSSEELFCASMLTGLSELSNLMSTENEFSFFSEFDLDSIESIQQLYDFEKQYIDQLPDSIQQIHVNSCVSQRLKLSLLVYRLIASVELGSSSKQCNDELDRVSEFIGISKQRASYDMSRQLVVIDNQASYKTYYFSQFLIASNIEALHPLST